MTERERSEGGREARGFRVSGRVQGVGFRWWTRDTAAALGLTGWVRNRPDGSVEVQARGRREQLDELERALQRGPIAARVVRVERIPPDGSAGLTSFDIEA